MTFCKFTDSSIMKCDVKNVTINKVDFSKCNFLKTSLKDIDFSACDISNILISENICELRGALISSMQAANIIKYLGVKINDEVKIN